MKTEMTDREIVSRIMSHGDAAAFSEVVRRYSSELYSKTLGVVKRTDVAQDIVQQAFCKAYMGHRHLARRAPRWSDFPAAGV